MTQRVTLTDFFFLGETSTIAVSLLSREHPKAQPGDWFLFLSLEKPEIKPATPGVNHIHVVCAVMVHRM